MIRNIEIKNLRGFRHFRLDGLAELTILTGRNACGKSTILEALLIGSAPRCAEAAGLAVKRHRQAKDGARWLFNEPTRPIEIRLETDADNPPLPRRLRFSEKLGPEGLKLAELLIGRGRSIPFRQIEAAKLGLDLDPVVPRETEAELGFAVFDLGGDFESSGTPESGPEAKLIDPSTFKELADAFSRFLEGRGHLGKQQLLKSVNPLIPGVADIILLTNPDDKPSLGLLWPDRAVPLSFAGEGIAAILRIAIEASLVGQGGLVLVEKPEFCLHPRAISEVAGILLGLVRHGRQVVITTHSLEMIDSLLGRSEDADIYRMCLFNLRPHSGEPKVVAWSGKEIDFVRNEIGDDLR